jgi:hypothetical protein
MKNPELYCMNLRKSALVRFCRQVSDLRYSLTSARRSSAALARGLRGISLDSSSAVSSVMNAEAAVSEAEAAVSEAEAAVSEAEAAVSEAEAAVSEAEAATAVMEAEGRMSSVKRGHIVRAEGNK